MNDNVAVLLALISMFTVCFSSAVTCFVLNQLNQIKLESTEKIQYLLQVQINHIVNLYKIIQFLCWFTLTGLLFVSRKPEYWEEVWSFTGSIVIAICCTFIAVSVVIDLCKSSTTPNSDINTNEKDKKEVTPPL